MIDILLPISATAQERAIEACIARSVEVPINNLWSADRCPADLLPWLAWALSVDDWDASWAVERQRAVIAASIDVHRHKGTRRAILATLSAQGYGSAELIEARQQPRYGRPGAIGSSARPFGEDWVYGPTDVRWPDYWITLKEPVGRSAVDDLARRLKAVAPVRCRLRAVSLSAGARFAYSDGLWAFGNQAPYGGVYNYEVMIDG